MNRRNPFPYLFLTTCLLVAAGCDAIPEYLLDTARAAAKDAVEQAVEDVVEDSVDQVIDAGAEFLPDSLDTDSAEDVE